MLCKALWMGVKVNREELKQTIRYSVSCRTGCQPQHGGGES